MSEHKQDSVVMAVSNALDKIRAGHEREIAALRASLAAAQRERDEARKDKDSLFRKLLIFINNEFLEYNRTEKEKGWNAACRSVRSEIERLSALETAKGRANE